MSGLRVGLAPVAGLRLHTVFMDAKRQPGLLPQKADGICALLRTLRPAAVLVHMGGAHFHDFGNAAIDFALKCPSITMVGSTIRSQPLLKAIENLGAQPVCFGSDAPFELKHVELARYRALLEEEVTT